MNTYLFHTSRGGRFFNAGFRSCEGINNSFNPEDYGINIYFQFEELENTASFAELSVNELIEKFDEAGYSLSELAYHYIEHKELMEEALNELKIKNIYGSYLEADDFGDVVVKDDTGHILCTLDELNSESGVLEIDGDYNKYDWKPASELDEDDLGIIIRDLDFDDYIDDLKYFLDKDLAKMIVNNQKHFQHRLDKYPFTQFALKAEDVFNVALEDFIKWSLEEDEDGEIEINSKYYSLK